MLSGVSTYRSRVAVEEAGGVIAGGVVAVGEGAAQAAHILLIDDLILLGLCCQIGQLLVKCANAGLVRAGERGSHLIQHGQIQGKALRGHVCGDHIQVVRLHQIFIQGALQLRLH